MRNVINMICQLVIRSKTKEIKEFDVISIWSTIKKDLSTCELFELTLNPP